MGLFLVLCKVCKCIPVNILHVSEKLTCAIKTIIIPGANPKLYENKILRKAVTLHNLCPFKYFFLETQVFVIFILSFILPSKSECQALFSHQNANIFCI